MFTFLIYVFRSSMWFVMFFYILFWNRLDYYFWHALFRDVLPHSSGLPWPLLQSPQHAVFLPSQSAPVKHNQGKKPTNLCALREFLKRMCLSCLRITILCVALHFMLCSRELHVLRAQRIIGFYLITHKPTRTENPIAWKLKHNCTLSAT